MTEPLYCVGESMAVVSTSDGSPLASAEAFSVSVGGAESNVAAHLALDGHRAAWLSRLGADPVGDRIVAFLAQCGVDTSFVLRDVARPSGLYLKDRVAGGATQVYYYRRGSAASFMNPDDLSAWALPPGSRVHTSGVLAAVSESCSRLLDAILDAGLTVSFDVNYRAALWGLDPAAERLRHYANRASTVFVGLDEAETLWGCRSAEDVAALLPGAHRLVVKDGAVEAVEFDRSDGRRALVTREPALRVDVVEPVGAGDAFAAGYLGADRSGATAAERLRAGHRLAAWNLGSLHDVRPRRGDDRD
ncbi:MAG: sugar kinase [Microcella sp.]|uniref:sugar kinase n=1 Tax=Microcella sp. TaxID=1913979 RepID=UPI003314C8EA